MVDEKPTLSLDSLLFPRLFRAFRMAIQPAKLALAFAAVTIICLAGWIMDLNPTVITGSYTVALPRGASTEIRKNQNATELDIYLLSNASLKNFVESREAAGGRAGVFSTLWHYGTKEFHHALYAIFSGNVPGVIGSVGNSIKALIWVLQWHPVYTIIFFLVVFVVLSVAGGAICRIAALQFARAERLGPKQAVQFALRRIVSLLGGPAGPVALIFVFGLPIILLGFVGNLPVVGELLTGLFLLLAFFAACAVTITLIGTVAGLGLMSPAVACENSDSFDAINHAFCYVYTKPWHMGFYTIVALIYGALCYIFVRFFGFLLLGTTHYFLQMGFVQHNAKLNAIWPEPTFANFLGPAGAMPDTWHLWLAALFVRLWVLAVIGLMVSFVISFYFSANTIIYTLMRQHVDGTRLDELYTSPDEAPAGSFASETSPEAGVSEPAVEMNGGLKEGLKTSE